MNFFRKFAPAILVFAFFIFINVVRVHAATAFITTWKTDNPGSSANNQITIPTTGSGYNYTVDWGQMIGGVEQISTGVTGNITHTYLVPGTYVVTITGSFPRIYFNNGGDKQKILTIQQWGSIGWTSMNAAFSGASNLTSVATDTPDLSLVTDMGSMFSRASSFNGDAGIGSWDVSHVTNMDSVFWNASSFNKDIHLWNMSNVTYLGNMFSGDTAFNQPVDSWDLHNVTNMDSVFYHATSFNQPLNSWNVSNVTYMGNMFNGATAFNQPLNSWNVSSVTSMVSMFSNATAFNGNIANWNVSHVADMDSMFYSAAAFNQAIGSWATTAVTNMQFMFANTTSFNQPLNNWNMSNVTNMYGTFYNATAFNQPLASWNVSHVSSMYAMFSYATSFNQPLNSWNISNLMYMTNMFNGADAFNQNLNSWNVSNVLYMAGVFGNTAAFNGNITGWDVHNVRQFNSMFSYATAFDQDLSSWDVSNATTISAMFYNATSFTNGGHALLWGTMLANVDDMSSLFGRATSFNQDISNWDTSNVTNMEGMFDGATSFNGNITGWDVHNVQYFDAMFRDAAAFNQNLSSWDVSNGVTFPEAFNNSALSTPNYDALLNGWSQLSLQSNVDFGASTIRYCTAGAARATLLATFDWTITDAGQGCPQAPVQSGAHGHATVIQTYASSGSGKLDFSINNGASTTASNVVTITMNADTASVSGYAVSLDASFTNGVILPYKPSATFTLPAQKGTYIIYLKYYSTTGNASAVLSHAITLTANGSTAIPFYRTLKAGMSGSDVKALQVFLNTHGYLIAKSGAGSRGKETMVFGTATKAALIAFQKAHASALFTDKTMKGLGIMGAATIKLISIN